ncbi:MAG: M14 family zinc carboxypeptidase [Candidatus Zixiibacteriota bacterium]
MSHATIRRIIVCMVGTLICAGSLSAGLHPSYSRSASVDTVSFYADGQYDRAVPTPEEFFGHPVGEWPIHYEQLVRYITALADISERVVFETHGTTHEGRDLFNVFISLPKNLRDRDNIRARLDRLADPAQVADLRERDAIMSEPAPLVATAWLGYSIHGDEVSGVDAAAQLMYHLAAGQDSATVHLLENLLIIIDPTQNPDGRERYLAMLDSYRSHVPNYDRHSQQHSGVWPWGRGNHYLFDLNRDWILLTQPETQGRVATILKWHPMLVVDAHEMGSNATYLFTPPREPVNYNTPENVRRWWKTFSEDQASAFDKRRWPYYIGEWHEQWYPGYGSAWPTFLGSIGILYEQAGVDGNVVRQQDDYLLTYHESVNHQFTSSLTNLFTAANNREQLLKDWHQARIDIVEHGRKSGLKFLIEPGNDPLKLQRFITRLIDQDIKVESATKSFTAPGVDKYGKEVTSHKYPVGTYIINTAQASGALAKAILDFDPRLRFEFLKEERRELEKHNETRMYEISSWSVPLAYDVNAYTTTARLSVETRIITDMPTDPGKLENSSAQYGFVIGYEGERTYRVLNRLFAEELTIYGSEKPFTLEGRSYGAGSVAVRRRGNPSNLVDILEDVASEYGARIIGVNSGFSSDGSLLGAPTFRLLQQPRVALLTGEPLNYNSFGSLWFTIDRELEIPHSLIRLQSMQWTDLSAYNVLIVPSAWGGGLKQALSKGGKKKLDNWVSAGGTLILCGSAAEWAADSSIALSQVRLKRQTLDKLSEYDTGVQRERQAEAPEVDTMALYHPERVKETDEKKEKQSSPSKEELKDHDEWQRKFHPRGSILRADIDTEHWLAFGMDKQVPVMVYTSYAFLANKPVKTVARFADKNSLRVSGLLWPEARERWANTAWATRESKGKGQIIMFANDPNLRAYFYGTRKMFVNAVLYGPGMGSRFDGPY